MDAQLRRSWAAKWVAINFIILILLGNFYGVERLTGQNPALWMQLTFLGAILGVASGGLGLAFAILRRWLNLRSQARGDDA